MAATVVVKTATGTAISVNGITIDPTGAIAGNALVFTGGQFVPGAGGGGGGITFAYQTVQANAVARTQRSVINFLPRFTAVDNAGNVSTDIDLAATGVSSGTYTSVTVDAYGRVTGGTNPPGSATLATAYTTGGSGGGVIGLTTSGGGLIARDNATPIAATLLGAQNSAGTTKFFDVTTSGAFSTAYDATLAAGLTLGGANATGITLGKVAVNTSLASALPLTTNVGTIGSSSLLFNQIWGTNYLGANVVVTFSATPTFTVASGETQSITLTGNITGWTVTNGTGAGQLLTLIFVQDATGSRTLAGTPANVKLAGGALALSTAANSRDSTTFRWDSAATVWQEVGRGMATVASGGASSLQASYTAGGAGGGAITLTSSGAALALTYQTINSAQTAGLSLINTIAATAGQQQYSPMIEFLGTGYNAASQVAKMAWQMRPSTGAPIYTDMVLWNSINGAAYTELMKITFDNASSLKLVSGPAFFFMLNSQGTGFTAGNGVLYFDCGGTGVFSCDSGGLNSDSGTAHCGSVSTPWKEVNSKHYVSQGTAPTIAVGTSTQLGSFPATTLAGTDTAGIITFTAGSGPAAFAAFTAVLVGTITYNTAYGAVPRSIQITPASSLAGVMYSSISHYYANDGTTTTWKLMAVTNSTNSFVGGNVYVWNYHVDG